MAEEKKPKMSTWKKVALGTIGAVVLVEAGKSLGNGKGFFQNCKEDAQMVGNKVKGLFSKNEEKTSTTEVKVKEFNNWKGGNK